MLRIEPVPADQYEPAMIYLVGGGKIASDIRTRALLLLDRFASARPTGKKFWRAMDDEQCLAAAIVLPSAGKVGFLHFSPAMSMAQLQACSALIDGVSNSAISDGLSLVQAVIHPDQAGDIQAARDGGMTFLVELIYMVADMKNRHSPPAESSNGLSWTSGDAIDQTELGKLILTTYESSLDCPALAGIRKIQDILESHRKSGIYTPENWHVLSLQGRPAACILVNGSSVSPGTCDIVYIGVAPEFRGRGLAKVLLDRAGAKSAALGAVSISLAVDSKNEYAMKPYENWGFHAIGSSLVYAHFRRVEARS